MLFCHFLCVYVGACGFAYVDLCPAGLVSNNKSMILQLLSQIRIGMDLTRIVLPAFIFEKRSLLEMYAEFFSHPDLLIKSVYRLVVRHVLQYVWWGGKRSSGLLHLLSPPI